jgi:hypothetical protein
MAAVTRSNWIKEQKIEKLRQKLGFNKIVLIQLLDTSIGRDLCIYRQQDIALWHGYKKIFLKQTKSQTLLGLYSFSKNQIVRNPKLGDLIFATSISYVFVHWCLYPLFHASNHLEVQILHVYLLSTSRKMIYGDTKDFFIVPTNNCNHH